MPCFIVPGGRPTLGCRCKGCEAARRKQWKRLTDKQATALKLLSFAVPVHHTTLSWQGIRGQTLDALKRMGLVRLMHLHEREGSGIGIPFWTRTQAGDELMKAVDRELVRF